MRFSIVAALAAAIGVGAIPVSPFQTYASDSVTFQNDRRLLFDTDGRQIDTYGAKINDFNGTYYVYGNSMSTTGASRGIKSYSSVDLVNWQYEGFLFDIDGDNPCSQSGACGRPHILYNSNTSTYILWVNAGSSGYPVATSSSPTGPFTFKSSTASIDPQFSDLQPADFTVEMINGRGYIVFSALNFRDPRAGNLYPQVYQTLHISELTSDLMNTTGVSYPVTSNSSDLVDQEAESPDIFKRGDYFYVAGSNTCGYCNGSLSILYRSRSIHGPWTRQILAGYGCESQFEAITPLRNPRTNDVSYVWSGTSVPGGDIRVAWTGHLFQPLSFRSDGSAEDLVCGANRSFLVPFTRGNGSVATGNATEAKDATPALAVYSPVCDSDHFILYQTWAASQSGTLEGISLNVARGAQTAPLSLNVFKFDSYNDLITPGYKWTALGTASFFANQTTWAFDTVTIPVKSNATVSKGDLLGFSMTGFDVSPWCHLEYETEAGSSFKLYQQGGGQFSLRGLSGRTSPVYERLGKSVKFFASYC